MLALLAPLPTPFPPPQLSDCSLPPPEWQALGPSVRQHSPRRGSPVRRELYNGAPVRPLGQQGFGALRPLNTMGRLSEKPAARTQKDRLVELARCAPEKVIWQPGSAYIG